MKYSEVQELYEREFISANQRDTIFAAYNLKARSNAFIVAISWFGGILVAAGIILLISANWDEIPRLVKIGGGIALMLLVHYAALSVKTTHAKAAEVLHFTGSLMFLANIALIGQVYHLSSRPGNAFAIWLVGIAALPWILRSQAQWFLILLGFGVWFGIELNDATSYLHIHNEFREVILFSLLGLVYAGIGGQLSRTSFRSFAGDTSKFGLFLFNVAALPLAWGIEGTFTSPAVIDFKIYLVMAVIAVSLCLAGLTRESSLTAQWKVVWGIAVTAVVLSMSMFFLSTGPFELAEVRKWLMLLLLSIFSLLEIKVGVERAVPFQVNLGIAMLGIYIFSAYILLIRSMAQTGFMFIISGVFLLILGVYLEKKRRTLISGLNLHPQTT